MSLQVFNKWVNTSMTEVATQAIDKFNQASRGALVLSPGNAAGDFNQTAFFAVISGLIRRRNKYGTGSVTAVGLSQLLDNAVKVAAGTPPVEYEPTDWAWMMKNPDEAGAVIGQQMGVGMVQDMLNSAITGLVAAVQGNTAVVNDVTAATDKTPSLAYLNGAAAKFGDRSQAIVAWVMHSTTWFSLLNKGLTNAERLFQFENVSIMQDAAGRPFIVTDSPALIKTDGVTSGTDSYFTLGLTSAAAVVENNGDFASSTIDVQGKENLIKSYQAEWSYNLGLKGYTWDTANGGKSPNDAAIGTATNWDKIATDNKDTGAVALESAA